MKNTYDIIETRRFDNSPAVMKFTVATNLSAHNARNEIAHLREAEERKTAIPAMSGWQVFRSFSTRRHIPTA